MMMSAISGRYALRDRAILALSLRTGGPQWLCHLVLPPDQDFRKCSQSRTR